MIRVVLPVRTCEWFSFVLMIIILMAHVKHGRENISGTRDSKGPDKSPRRLSEPGALFGLASQRVNYLTARRRHVSTTVSGLSEMDSMP